jgi:hypothetical protein
MNYLDLINAVLVRLREDIVDASTYASDPFYRMVGATVNDAKQTIEESWQWGALRGSDDIALSIGDNEVILPESADRNYVIKTVFGVENANFMAEASINWMKWNYQNEGNEPVAPNNPAYWSTLTDDPATLNKRILLYPPTNKALTVRVDRVKQTPNLVEWDDVLLIPSLPVYSLATALASRERGEVGGAPTSALFAQASSAMSDAIAYDSARFESEMDWWGGNDRPAETNVRQY